MCGRWCDFISVFDSVEASGFWPFHSGLYRDQREMKGIVYLWQIYNFSFFTTFYYLKFDTRKSIKKFITKIFWFFVEWVVHVLCTNEHLDTVIKFKCLSENNTRLKVGNNQMYQNSIVELLDRHTFYDSCIWWDAISRGVAICITVWVLVSYSVCVFRSIFGFIPRYL